MHRFCQPGRNAGRTKPVRPQYRAGAMEDEFDVVIEIPRGSRNKYEYDHEHHVMRLDRRLFSATVYPADYGFVPDTLARGRRPARRARAARGPDVPGLLGPGAGHRRVLDGGREGPRRQDPLRARPRPGVRGRPRPLRAPAARCSTRSSTSSTCTRCSSRTRTPRPAAPGRDAACRRSPTPGQGPRPPRPERPADCGGEQRGLRRRASAAERVARQERTAASRVSRLAVSDAERGPQRSTRRALASSEESESGYPRFAGRTPEPRRDQAGGGLHAERRPELRVLTVELDQLVVAALLDDLRRRRRR